MMRAFARQRRGRPVKPANDNDPARTGRDGGTAELQAKRAQMARGLDPAQCAHPLDLLLARGWVSAAEHRAGWRYAGFYRRLNGRGAVSYSRFYESFTGTGTATGTGTGSDTGAAAPPDEADLALMQRQYRLAKEALLSAGERTARMTEAVSVFGIWPGFIFAADMTAGEGRAEKDLASLRRGLATLARSFANPPQ